MQSWKDLDLPILRNRVLRQDNIHISVVPPCYVVDFLILKKRFFRLRNVQILVSGVLEGGRSADIHEFCFHAAKRSGMYCVEMQWGSIC